MSLLAELQADMSLIDASAESVFLDICEAAFGSIVDGSPVTGAPGQPIATGDLRSSWTLTLKDPRHAVIASDSDHAIFIEGDARGLTFRNGGPHSVRMTEVNFGPLVASVVGGSVFGDSL